MGTWAGRGRVRFRNHRPAGRGRELLHPPEAPPWAAAPPLLPPVLERVVSRLLGPPLLHRTGDRGCPPLTVGPAIDVHEYQAIGHGNQSINHVILGKLIKEELSFFYIKKLQYYCFLGLHKGLPGYRRSLQPPKEKIQYCKTLIFLIFVGHFRPAGAGSAITNRIHADPNPQHWKLKV